MADYDCGIQTHMNNHIVDLAFFIGSHARLLGSTFPAARIVATLNSHDKANEKPTTWGWCFPAMYGKHEGRLVGGFPA